MSSQHLDFPKIPFKSTTPHHPWFNQHTPPAYLSTPASQPNSTFQLQCPTPTRLRLHDPSTPSSYCVCTTKKGVGSFSGISWGRDSAGPLRGPGRLTPKREGYSIGWGGVRDLKAKGNGNRGGGIRGVGGGGMGYPRRSKARDMKAKHEQIC
eukprot:763285-Hanusia_phi.AAC.3